MLSADGASMNDFLSRLAARSRGTAEVVVPRVPSFYEPYAREDVGSVPDAASNSISGNPEPGATTAAQRRRTFDSGETPAKNGYERIAPCPRKATAEASVESRVDGAYISTLKERDVALSTQESSFSPAETPARASVGAVRPEVANRALRRDEAVPSTLAKTSMLEPSRTNRAEVVASVVQPMSGDSIVAPQ